MYKHVYFNLSAFAVCRMRGIFSVTIMLLVALAIAVEAGKTKGELLFKGVV